jgi:hypothetical protein
MATRTHQRGNAASSCSALEKDAGCNEEDPTLSLVTSSARTTGSDPDQEEVVQEETTPDDIPFSLTPFGLMRTKLEPTGSHRIHMCCVEHQKRVSRLKTTEETKNETC